MQEKPLRQALKNLHPSEIRPNPENPRLIFRQEEMESLMLSIDRHGIQVPVTVYEDNGHYSLTGFVQPIDSAYF
jgi:ParB-like chromosome segregation protein Spo0J